MSTVILVFFVLPMFFARDWLLLRMGPVETTVVRLRQYGVVLLLSMVLLSTLVYSASTESILEVVFKPLVTSAVVMFYGVLLAICIWIRRTDHHQVAWLIAILPNPVLIGAIAVLARMFFPETSQFTTILGSALLTFLWISLIGFSVWEARNTPLDVPDLDFSLNIAGLVNSAALMLLPFGAWIGGSAAWSSFFQQLGAMLSAD
jgi:hypothetical protein